MGFAVSSSPAIGHVAMADINSTSSKTQSAHSRNEGGPKAVEVEERKVTVTSFGENKVGVKVVYTVTVFDSWNHAFMITTQN